MVYTAYNIVIDAPMYLARYHADQASGSEGGGKGEGEGGGHGEGRGS